MRVADLDTAGVADAWAVGDDTLLHTADAGRTWAVLARGLFSAVSFADRAAGIAVVGTQLATTGDGGRTWRPRRSPCTQATDPIDVSASGTSRRYVLCTGQPGAGSQPRALWQSVDGGRTWKCTYCDLSMSPGYAQGIDFVGARGWLWYRRGRFTSTPDGGRSWTTLPIGKPEAVEGESASHYSGRGGYALLHDTRLRPLRLRLAHTTDGGRTWRDVRVWRVRFWPR